MPKREVTVASAVGLHARPAAIFVKAATQAKSDHGLTVTVGRVDGPPADASSILAVMSLGAKQGETLVLEAEGDGAESVLDELAAVVGKEA